MASIVFFKLKLINEYLRKTNSETRFKGLSMISTEQHISQICTVVMIYVSRPRGRLPWVVESLLAEFDLSGRVSQL